MMKASLKKALADMKVGKWCFDSFVPAIRKALAARTASKNSTPENSISGLSLAALEVANNVSYDIVMQSQDSHRPVITGRRPEDPRSDAFWNPVLQQLSYKGKYGIVDLKSVTAKTRASLVDACAWIDEVDNDASIALRTHCTYLCCTEGGEFTSVSLPKALGIIFENPREDVLTFKDLAVILIHELGHQELFALNTADRLIDFSSDKELVHSPLQGYSRPPIGRLHSAHAIFRMLAFEIKAKHQHIDGLKRDLRNTIATLKETSLTPFGRALVDDVYQTWIDK